MLCVQCIYVFKMIYMTIVNFFFTCWSCRSVVFISHFFVGKLCYLHS
uniref:Uncharacterized protein n=1 Tax=Anguilla anguilla TaxID=7936 RepID=A0A0E9UVF9_ANGAN